MSCRSITTRILLITTLGTTYAFIANTPRVLSNQRNTYLRAQADGEKTLTKALSNFCATVAITASLFHGGIQMAYAEDELAAKYGGGLDTSLVDQTCLVDRCSLQAKVSKFSWTFYPVVERLLFIQLVGGNRELTLSHFIFTKQFKMVDR